MIELNEQERINELEQKVHIFAVYLAKFCRYCEREGSCPIFYSCPAQFMGMSCGDITKEDWIESINEVKK